MLSSRKFNSRILFVTALSLGACYLGVRTGADTKTTMTFKGQGANAYYISDDEYTIAEVTCIVGNDGNAKPSPVQTVWLDDEVDSPSTQHYASTFGYVNFTGSYSPINNGLNSTATCDATATGDEQAWDFNAGTFTDYGPVSIHGVTTIGNPAVTESGVSTTIERDRSAGVMIVSRSHGKMGLQPTGTVSISSSSVNGLPAINHAIGDPLGGISDIQIVDSGTATKLSQ